MGDYGPHRFSTGAWLRDQWSNPSDIFTILLIIGGDVVQVAIAQLCAGPVPGLTPVSFSFGWVNQITHFSKADSLPVLTVPKLEIYRSHMPSPRCSRPSARTDSCPNPRSTAS